MAVCCLFFAIALSLSGSTAAKDGPVSHSRYGTRGIRQQLSASHILVVTQLRQEITLQRKATWAWERQALLAPSRSEYSEKESFSLKYLRWDLQQWHRLHRLAQTYAQHPPHEAEWLCIHSGWKGNQQVSHGEASWKNPGRDWLGQPSPFHGGLSMDPYFEALYGRQFVIEHGGRIEGYPGHYYAVGGQANTWSPLEQMWAAENALKHGRGFYPWPNTAPPCVSSMSVNPSSVRTPVFKASGLTGLSTSNFYTLNLNSTTSSGCMT
jgi:hypothetical protein